MLAFLYIIPLTGMSKGLKILLFILFLVIASIINNIVAPQKSVWTVSIISDNGRGNFFATNEMVSLISGIFISLFASGIIDSYEARGEINTAFIILGISIIALSVIQGILLMFCKEKKIDVAPNEPMAQKLKSVILDKNFLLLLPYFALSSAAMHASSPFASTYALGELLRRRPR